MIHLLESVRKLCGSWNSFLARVLVELKLARSWQLCLIRFAIPFAEWMFHNHFETAFQDSRSQKTCSLSSYAKCQANLTLRTIFKFPKIISIISKVVSVSAFTDSIQFICILFYDVQLYQEHVGTMWRLNPWLIFSEQQCRDHLRNQLLHQRPLQMRNVRSISL